jgi:CRP/FNR family cyclic AMP-dependent transcriptional regulator
MPGLNREDMRALFSKNFFFGTLGESDVERLLTYAQIVRYRAGAEIFAKGSPGLSLMAVLKGTVRISVVSESGREIVLNLIQPGEIFGEIALLDGRDRTADATAMIDCELLVLNRRDFLPFLERRPDLCIKVIELLCQRLRQTSEQVEELSFWQLEGRLAKALLRLAQERVHAAAATAAGSSTKRPAASAAAITVSLRITQRELGSMVGGSREHVNKQLKTWQKTGLIELGKGEIAIRDPDALAEFCDET